jgi:predicted DNA-binding transcriptional regulator AlpA
VFAATFRCVGRRVDLDDRLDAGEVAELLGLASANVVNVYRGRHQDFPAPVLTRRGLRLWLRGDVEVWARDTGRSHLTLVWVT